MRCHLCTLWAALFDHGPQPLTPEPTCQNCRGIPAVRETLRRSIFLKNVFLAEALSFIREPLADPEPIEKGISATT